jgi:hypothetical protein
MSNKPILVITHERSGTHLLINLINYHKNGNFVTIGYQPKLSNKIFTLKDYINTTYKHIMTYAYVDDVVCKSHHQVEFMDDYLDFLFSRYNVIYVERNLLDVLLSYYKFLPGPLNDFPKIDDWVFMNPSNIGKKYLTSGENHLKGPDPHIYIEPNNYIDRWLLHKNGWLKYKTNLLHIHYEDILTDFKNTKDKIENYIGRKIGDSIPDINNEKLPNFNPGKGIINAHKEVMSEELIKKINIYIKNNKI